MRATWQNTAFARPGEAWGRFARTVAFVRTRTYGSIDEVERAARRVRKVHASLTGTDEDGSVIRLDEPELLLWVHCGEIASYGLGAPGGGPVQPPEAWYCREHRHEGEARWAARYVSPTNGAAR